MANKIKTQLPKEFPSISRLITELVFSKLAFLLILTTIIFALAFVLLGKSLIINFKNKTAMEAKRAEITKSVAFWEESIAKYPNFRDAYIMASLLKYRLGEDGKALEYAEHALSIDPDSKEAKKLEELLLR